MKKLAIQYIMNSTSKSFGGKSRKNGTRRKMRRARKSQKGGFMNTLSSLFGISNSPQQQQKQPQHSELNVEQNNQSAVIGGKQSKTHKK